MNYDEQRKTIQTALIRYYIGFFLLPIPALVLVVLSALIVGEIFSYIIAVVCLVLFVFVEQRLSRNAFGVPCPRCQHRFWLSKYDNFLLAKPCQNCGLSPFPRNVDKERSGPETGGKGERSESC